MKNIAGKYMIISSFAMMQMSCAIGVLALLIMPGRDAGIALTLFVAAGNTAALVGVVMGSIIYRMKEEK